MQVSEEPCFLGRVSPRRLLQSARYFGDFRFMNAARSLATSAAPSPQLSPQSDSLQKVQSISAQAAYSPKRQLHVGVRRAIAFESSVKLTVNLLLATVAATTIAKLVPYYQGQQQRLSTLQESVTSAEKKNAELRSQFSRNFDPTQAGRIMQEQSGMGYPNQKPVVWTEPTVEPAVEAATEPSNEPLNQSMEEPALEPGGGQ